MIATASRTQSKRESRRDMAPKMVSGGVTADYRQPLSVGTRKVALDEQLARSRGGEPGTWHQRRVGRYPINHQVADVVETMLARGETVEAAAFLAPIDAAREGHRDLPLTLTLIRTAHAADCDEDKVLTVFAVALAAGEVTPKMKREMLEHLDREIARKQELRAGLLNSLAEDR